MTSPFVFYRTLRDLKAIQLKYRLWYFLLSRWRRRPLPNPPSDIHWSGTGQRVPFPLNDRVSGRWLETGRFCFLNQPAAFDAVDWQARGFGRLWRYNLHYFDYLLPADHQDVSAALTLIRDWIDGNPPGTPDAWDPYPVSLRLVNWIKFLADHPAKGPEIQTIFRNMALQAQWLMSRMEYHLLGNHLFKNAKALVFMGVFFRGGRSSHWLAKGLAVLKKELDEQILSDGGHFERSPMYHAMILEDCLDLVNILDRHPLPEAAALGQTLAKKSRTMARFLAGITHPDGDIGLFNDAALDIEAKPDRLFDYCRQVTGRAVSMESPPALAFPHTGYYVLSPDPGHRLIMDCGPVGPAYQAGHSHCDTLSFELSVQGIRVITDSGCFGYEPGQMRHDNRSTLGHNTLCLDQTDQSEIWAAHRCGAKAAPLEVRCGSTADGGLFFKGGHSGYRRLKGSPLHFREVGFERGTWTIFDRVEGRGTHSVRSRLHIHPDMEVDFLPDRVRITRAGKHVLSIRLTGPGERGRASGWYCPGFGKKILCQVVECRADHAALPFETGWKLETKEQ